MSPLIFLLWKILYHVYNILLCSVILFSCQMFSDKGLMFLIYENDYVLITVPLFVSYPDFLCPSLELWCVVINPSNTKMQFLQRNNRRYLWKWIQPKCIYQLAAGDPFKALYHQDCFSLLFWLRFTRSDALLTCRDLFKELPRCKMTLPIIGWKKMLQCNVHDIP